MPDCCALPHKPSAPPLMTAGRLIGWVGFGVRPADGKNDTASARRKRRMSTTSACERKGEQAERVGLNADAHRRMMGRTGEAERSKLLRLAHTNRRRRH